MHEAEDTCLASQKGKQKMMILIYFFYIWPRPTLSELRCRFPQVCLPELQKSREQIRRKNKSIKNNAFLLNFSIINDIFVAIVRFEDDDTDATYRKIRRVDLHFPSDQGLHLSYPNNFLSNTNKNSNNNKHKKLQMTYAL